MAQTTNPQESLWGVDSSPAIKSYTLSNLRKIPQIEKFSEEQNFDEMKKLWGGLVDQIAFVDYNPWENSYLKNSNK